MFRANQILRIKLISPNMDDLTKLSMSLESGEQDRQQGLKISHLKCCYDQNKDLTLKTSIWVIQGCTNMIYASNQITKKL